MTTGSLKSDALELDERRRLRMKRILLRSIAVAEVLGGTFGILIALLMSTSPAVPYASVLMISVPSGFSVLAGYHLWYGRNKGFKFSLIIQAFQIIAIWTQSFSFQVYLFVALYLSIGPGTFGLRPTIGATSMLGTERSPEGLVLGVNIVAIATAVYLIRAQKQQISEPQSDASSETDETL